MQNIDELINLLDEMTDDITRQVREAKEKAIIEKLPTMLKENGVNLCITEYRGEGNSVDELRFGFGIDRLDFTAHDKPFKDKIKSLQEECSKLHKQLMETEKDMQEEIIVLSKQIADLQCELADKEDKEDKKCDCKSKKIAVVVAERINGQDYIRLEDFNAIINDL
jgi:hypothetical protein